MTEKENIVYLGPERRQRFKEQWHVRREISITHIVATVGIIVSAIAGYYDLKETDLLLTNEVAKSRQEAATLFSSLTNDMEHNGKLQAQVDLAQNTEIGNIHGEITDARQEFRDEHSQTRREVKQEQKETREVIMDLFQKTLSRN